MEKDDGESDGHDEERHEALMTKLRVRLQKVFNGHAFADRDRLVQDYADRALQVCQFHSRVLDK